MRHVANRRADRHAAYDDKKRAVVSLAGLATARHHITAWHGYQPTPLVNLSDIASALDLGKIHFKNEAGRFGIGSFKALGGAYAVQRLLATQPDPASVTVCCATDGNHGRSVAWAARNFGCRAVIHLHETVSQSRENAIAAFGARTIRCPGNYDDSVRQAAKDAAANGWHVVSDTSYDGYMTIPRDVMQGYALLVDEAMSQMPAGEIPTHVFAQAGVGGFAAAMCGTLWEMFAEHRPTFVVVEPEDAACIFDSIAAGAPRSVTGALDTIMAGLACGDPSALAWEILATGADHVVTIPDSAAMDTMRLLAPSLVSGESGVAGLAALRIAATVPTIRQALGLTTESRVLLFGTEGATDPELYASIIGH